MTDPSGRHRPISEQLAATGDTLFQWRSYAPLVLVPLFAVSVWDSRAPTPFLWEVACFLVALSGLAIRAFVIGTAPEGASTRGTRQPSAGTLSTRGAYSVVRHPLYLANSLVALGCSLLSGTWYLPVIVVLLGFIYHERIAAREEAFLRNAFEEQFVSWARDVPAMIPHAGNYLSPDVSFRWRKVLVQESHGLCALGTAFLVLDTLEDSLRLHVLHVDRRWLAVFIVTLVPFLLVAVTKKTGRWMNRSRTPAAAANAIVREPALGRSKIGEAKK